MSLGALLDAEALVARPQDPSDNASPSGQSALVHALRARDLPVRARLELFLRVADVRGFWGYFLPLDFTLSTSALFELIEWGVALVVGGDLGAAYLGTQGDIWDAHKDMALAGLGAADQGIMDGFVHRGRPRPGASGRDGRRPTEVTLVFPPA